QKHERRFTIPDLRPETSTADAIERRRAERPVLRTAHENARSPLPSHYERRLDEARKHEYGTRVLQVPIERGEPRIALHPLDGVSGIVDRPLLPFRARRGDRGRWRRLVTRRDGVEREKNGQHEWSLASHGSCVKP